MASHDWDKAQQVAEEQFLVDLKGATILPEEEYLVESHRALIKKMIECYRDAYAAEEYQIVRPEVEFDVELPNSGHNCIWLHHWERVDGHLEKRWGPPNPDAILRGDVFSPHGDTSTDCRCFQPHRLVGRTDALMLWKGMLWLQEHKTTSIDSEQFWGTFQLDIQPTIYILGIWRSLGLMPHGVVVDAIRKPSEAQVAAWNSKRKYGPGKGVVDYINYSREPFLRSEADLLRCEKDMKDLCDEWEERIVRGRFNMSPVKGACFLYNRACDYHMACLNHDSPAEFEALQPLEEGYYVDVKLEELTKRVAPKEVS